ncbi:APC family permease [Shewanella surugensis]|uniref:APC family permease n=1 Tax=Shewanella surugensis TaxID=212020 RepID=A0ABT0LAX4_9GAMM|nr:APC family permease [Shewanella surugensis]MCL1124841.1 APC family permease [Shewanella surugensis]
MPQTNRPGLLSTIFFSVGTMIGSGWLYAAYYSSKIAGGASILSWIIGAIIVLGMALLLAEIAIKHPINGLFTRLISLSHNQHFGFVTGISNWLLGLIIVPAEAMASTQYIASIYASWTPYLFKNEQITLLGMGLTSLFMLFYLLVNFWGIRLLSRVNNVITWIKVILPTTVAIIFIINAFDSTNFTAYKDSIIPYGIGSIFTAIVSSGIFYSFFGFQAVVSFCAELDNPKRNIPITLVFSVLIVLIIYLLLQIAFIGALPHEMLTNGWSSLKFESPLAQLAGILGLNMIVIALYADSIVSPTGSGLMYLGIASRQLNEMVKYKQMPAFFGSRDIQVQFSRRALSLSFICSLILIVFFRNWQLIASLTTTFIIISCIALPIAYTKMLQSAEGLPVRILPYSKLCSLLIFIFLSYFLLLCGLKNLTVAFVLHLVFFITYACNINTQCRIQSLRHAFYSAWAIFTYMFFVIMYNLVGLYLDTNYLYYTVYIIISMLFYILLINQKSIEN